MKALHLFLAILISLSSRHVFAKGPGEGGGGDPLAGDFLENGLAVKALLESHAIPGVEEDTELFGTWLTRIRESLDGRNPILTLPPGRTLECFGATKIGCVNEDGSIRVARETYESYRTPEKFEVVALEIFRLMGVRDRYPKAHAIAEHVRLQSATIESHVQFMIAYQINTFSLRHSQDKVTFTTCTDAGQLIQQTDILTELIQMLVMEGKWDIKAYKAADELSKAARALFPFCGINEVERSRNALPAVVDRIDAAITKMKAVAGSLKPQLSPAQVQPDQSKSKAAALVRTPKPGLHEGQTFKLPAELRLSANQAGNSWTYFTNGRAVDVETLLRQEGQGYCALTSTEGKMPKALILNGVRTIPPATFKLVEISWYVDTVFFSTDIPGAGETGLVAYCGTIQGGRLGKVELTLAAAIATHLKSILELQ